jgi:hypothetical protein
MEKDRTEFKPFGVESRARPYRLAFLVDAEVCSPELLDSLFKANYGLWGGRFNPIIPVCKGEIDEAFWSLLTYVDPDLVYTYASLSQGTIDRISRDIGPWRIEKHPSHLTTPGSPPHYFPHATEELVKSRQVLPLLMSRPDGFAPTVPTLLSYFHDSKSPLNDELVRLVTRNFGIIQERAYPLLPDEWARLQVQNSWTPMELLHGLTCARNVVFPFQSSAAYSVFPDGGNPQEEYCILVGDNTDTWLYFWNRIFLVRDYFRTHWHTLCLTPALLQEESFVNNLREFLRRYVLRSGNSPSRLTLQSFECSENELSQLRGKLSQGIDAIITSKRLVSSEFPPLLAIRSENYDRWESREVNHQQATSRESLLSPPRCLVPIDQGTWVMDLRIQYIPRVAFYSNEILSWKLPRRAGVAEGFFPHSRCRIDADYSISIEMPRLTPFLLKIPSESEMFHRVAGVMEMNPYDSNLTMTRKKPQFRRLGKWDKGLYLNGILELFGGLQSASRFFEHSYWRGVFERLSLGVPEKEADLFDRVRNRLEKKKSLIASQLAVGNSKPVDWLTHLVMRHARELQLRPEEISFAELESGFLAQRERFIAANPTFRQANSPEAIAEDQKRATADFVEVLQSLTDGGVLQQGVRARCTNCGSRFWREIGSLQQKVRCDGCNATVSIPVECRWRYRLNSLVRNGIALHGCVPVISALRSLREQARESFIYTHGVALFRSYDDPKPAAEMDILCISNGRLICGEVKSSASEFTQEELLKLARIAVDIGADQAAISAFHDPNGVMLKNREALAKLLPPACNVTICGPAPWAFEPQPHPF